MRQSRLESSKNRGAWIIAWVLGGLVVVVLVIVAVMERPSQPAPMAHPSQKSPPVARTVQLPGALSPSERNSLPPPVPGHYANIMGHPGPR